jgi:hypothetical protein
VAEILPGVQYNSYRVLSHISNGYLHTPIQPMVWELCNFEVSWTAGISGLIRFEQSDNFKLLSLVQVQS